MAAVAARLVDKMVVNPNNNGSCLGSADDVVRRDFKEESDSDMDYRPIPMEEPVHSIKMEEPAELKVEIVNVLCNFKTHCHLNLRKVCTEGVNVEYRKDPASVLMKLRSPKITATIWSSGKVICMGARSEADALLGARRIARKLQKCGFDSLRFVDFQVKNVLGVLNLPFGVRIDHMKQAYTREVSYEPELHPAASWRVPETGGQLQVFQTGNLSVTAPNVEAAQKTFQAVYPRLLEFRKAKETVDISSARAKKAPAPDKSSAKRKKTNGGGVSLKAFQLPDDFKDFKEEIDSDDTDD